MAGVYVHVPFCRKACTYCDFHFSTNLQQMGRMANAIAQEAFLRRHFFPSDAPLDTLYFGGGTPSLLDEEDLRGLFSALRRSFSWKNGAEVTLEANPDDLSDERLALWRELGINRLSIGVQSFREADLQLMNRSHNAAQAREALQRAAKHGFENLTLDLIYGIPGLDETEWLDNVRQVVELGIPHVSAYALTVEEKTALHHQVQKGQVAMPPDDAYTRQYESLVATLTGAGYEHYELSNFARSGFRSRHNSAYWSGEPYLGLGPSAHSFLDPVRSWNVAHNALYMKQVEAGQSPEQESETLQAADQLNEYFLTHLRLSEGLDEEVLANRFAYDLDKEAGTLLREFIRQGWMVQEGSKWKLTPSGKMVSNHIISELFVEPEN